MLAYLLEGLAGVPVFAGAGAGPGYMTGPTGGYLAGFLIGATVVGWARRDVAGTAAWVAAAASMALGHLLVFVPGVLWLATLLGWTQGESPSELTPFLAATAIKISLGVALVAGVFRSLLGQRRRGRR